MTPTGRGEVAAWVTAAGAGMGTESGRAWDQAEMADGVATHFEPAITAWDSPSACTARMRNIRKMPGRQSFKASFYCKSWSVPTGAPLALKLSAAPDSVWRKKP